MTAPFRIDKTFSDLVDFAKRHDIELKAAISASIDEQLWNVGSERIDHKDTELGAMLTRDGHESLVCLHRRNSPEIETEICRVINNIGARVARFIEVVVRGREELRLPVNDSNDINIDTSDNWNLGADLVDLLGTTAGLVCPDGIEVAGNIDTASLIDADTPPHFSQFDISATGRRYALGTSKNSESVELGDAYAD